MTINRKKKSPRREERGQKTHLGGGVAGEPRGSCGPLYKEVGPKCFARNADLFLDRHRAFSRYWPISVDERLCSVLIEAKTEGKLAPCDAVALDVLLQRLARLKAFFLSHGTLCTV